MQRNSSRANNSNPINPNTICPNCKQQQKSEEYKNFHLETCKIKYKYVSSKVRCQYCNKKISNTSNSKHLCKKSVATMAGIMMDD